MNFGKIIESLIDGSSVRRKSWPDDGTHIKIVKDMLTIFKPEDRAYHPLTVSLGDLEGEDWVVCG